MRVLQSDQVRSLSWYYLEMVNYGTKASMQESSNAFTHHNFP